MAIDLSPVSDFFSNIKDKLTNPFFGTLILVWLTRNWELVYSIFNFDKNLQREDKVIFIKTYFNNLNFWYETFINVGLALVTMVIGYGLVVLTRTLSMWIEHFVMPRITNIVVSKNVVLKEEYDKANEDRDLYFNRYSEERKSVRKLSDDYEQILMNFKEMSTESVDLSKRLSVLKKSHDSLKKIEEEKTLKLKEKEDIITDKELVLSFLRKDVKSYVDDIAIYHNILVKKNLNITNYLLQNKEILRITKEIIKQGKAMDFIVSAEYLIRGSNGSMVNSFLEKMYSLNVFNLSESGKPKKLNIYGELIYYHILNNTNIKNEDFLKKITLMESTD